MCLIKKSAAFLPFVATISACSGSPTTGGATQGQSKPHAAEMSILVDGSASTAFIASPAYTDAAIKQVGSAVMRQKLGDSFRIAAFGNRSIDNAVDVLSEKSGYNRHLPAVRKRVEAALTDLTQRKRQLGGDGSTNLTYSMEYASIRCAPGSRLIVLSDGLSEDEGYSTTRALAQGKPVHLPLPKTPYLEGCAVEMIGVGMAPSGVGNDAQTLPREQMQRLIAGLREYLSAAGVRQQDMTFTSLL